MIGWRRGVRATVLVLLAPVALAACGGGGDAANQSPREALATAKATMDRASSWHLSLSTSSKPSSGNAVLGADGTGTHSPRAWKGSVRVVLSGLVATVPLVSVSGKVYAKLPLTTAYTTIDPSQYDAPDPANFMDPRTGLSALLTELTGARRTGTARAGSQIVTTYAGTLSGTDVARVIPSASTSARYRTVVAIDSDHQVTSVNVTGPFFSSSAPVTYRLGLSGYGQDVTISAP